MAKIFIVGSGSFGTALAVTFASSNHSVTLWSYEKGATEYLRKNKRNELYLKNVQIPDSVSYTDTFEEITNSDIVVMAVPSHAVLETAKKIRPYVKQGQDVLNVAKGFEPKSLERLSTVIKRELPEAEVSVLSGPSHAEEVAVLLPTTNVIANENIEIAKRLQNTLSSEVFRIYAVDDPVGAEIGGALKNVIALCTGISDGFGFGDNTRAAIMTRGMSEIIRFGVAFGAKFETFMGLSGFGDLIVTCTSMHSRNRRFGMMVGGGMDKTRAEGELGMVVEGISATKAAYELSKKIGVEMPIVNAAYSVLFENNSVESCVSSLMKRPVKIENA